MSIFEQEECTSPDEENGFPEKPKLTFSISEPLPSPEKVDTIVKYRSVSDPTIKGKKSIESTEFNLNLSSAITSFLEMLPRPALIPTSPILSSSLTVQVFNCVICLENHSTTESFKLERCDRNHQFCRSSMSSFLSSQIKEGLTSFKCPMYGDCQGIFSEEEVESLVDSNTYKKYLRFKIMKQDQNYRECPWCSSVTLTGTKETPEITCKDCGLVFCYHHANAHPNISCQMYVLSQSRRDMQARSLISKLALKCPKCQVDTEKSGGCNHMTCQQCNEDWCWLCGKSISGNASGHYTTPGLCFGSQFDMTPSWACWGYCPCSFRVLFFVFGLWKIPLVLLVYVVAFLAGCCGVILIIVCSPVTIAIIIYRGSIDCRNADNQKVLGFPGVVGASLLAGSAYIVTQILWTAFSLIYIGALFLGKFLGFRTDTSSLMTCCSNDNGEANDRTMEIFLFPLLFSMSLFGRL